MWMFTGTAPASVFEPQTKSVSFRLNTPMTLYPKLSR